MSITTRITLSILVLVVVTAGLSWLAVHRMVIRPFADDVRASHLREIAYVGRRLARGEDPHELEEELGLAIEPWDRPIPRNHRAHVLRGQEIVVVRGPAGPERVLLKTPSGRVSVRQQHDPERRVRGIPPVLLLVVAGIVVVALLIARRSVVPLTDTTRAMARMGAGDLDHRLPEQGPSEVRAASRAFNELADRVKHLLATERQLLAGISHELRTPLTRLRLETELLRDAGVDPKRLDRMDGDLTQLDDLIGEALELSRLQLGVSPLQKEPASLLDLAREHEAPDVRVVGEGSEVQVDRFLVGRALQNLISNARKYAPGSPVAVTVEGATIRVRDEGPGVPAPELPQLFEPFYRTRGGSQRAEGHGLGLMLVRTIATLHGGRVEARNAEPGLEVALHLAPS
ncbi:MAG: HAMP domain-containing histidine kinase [Myxococcales bacterium]|nr:HAMP domain-containing histidine kinase [Myxococcales bacterium]MCB9693697.1 HAMP domain-containing histidine kinase [Alphaproteobacteria bacterium]